jgi:hypothetical protein
LARLIESVWRYPTVLSRERHRSRRPPDEFDLADRRFDEIAGPGGADFIDPRIPAADFEELREETATVRKWVNTSVAHLTAKESPRETPPLPELHSSLDVVARMFVKYMNLIQGVHVVRSVVMESWPAIFRVPWIADQNQFVAVMTKIEQAEAEALARPSP